MVAAGKNYDDKTRNVFTVRKYIMSNRDADEIRRACSFILNISRETLFVRAEAIKSGRELNCLRLKERRKQFLHGMENGKKASAS